MSFPFHYDHGAPLVFGGAVPEPRSFDDSRVVILPVPVDRTTSYVPGTRSGPREILQASSHMELWDEEMQADIHGVGIFTLPEMELPFGEMAPLIDEIERVAYEVIGRDKFLLTLGGEHSITPPLVSAAARKHPGLSLLQIDAHADMRDAYVPDAAAWAAVAPAQAGLDPVKDPILREDPKGPYVNLIAVRAADKDKPWVKILVDSYHTPEVKEFVLTKFKGAVLPSW